MQKIDLLEGRATADVPFTLVDNADTSKLLSGKAANVVIKAEYTDEQDTRRRDTFSNAALDAAAFGTSLAGAGSVVETTSLAITTPAAADAAVLYDKAPISFSNRFCLHAHIKVSANAGSGTDILGIADMTAVAVPFETASKRVYMSIGAFALSFYYHHAATNEWWYYCTANSAWQKTYTTPTFTLVAGTEYHAYIMNIDGSRLLYRLLDASYGLLVEAYLDISAIQPIANSGWAYIGDTRTAGSTVTMTVYKYERNQWARLPISGTVFETSIPGAYNLVLSGAAELNHAKIRLKITTDDDSAAESMVHIQGNYGRADVRQVAGSSVSGVNDFKANVSALALEATAQSIKAKADAYLDAAVSGRASQASIDALNNFDPATDVVIVGTNNDKDGYGLSSGAVQAVWDALTSALSTVGSIGKRIADYLDAAISSRASSTALYGAISQGVIGEHFSIIDSKAISIVRGDVKRLVLNAGPGWDMTDRRVYFCMKADKSGEEAVVDRECTITEAAMGVAEIVLTPEETATVGRYYGEFEMRDADGLSNPRTIRQMEIRIIQDVRQ